MRSALLIVLLLIVGCYLMDNDAASNVMSTTDQTNIGKVKFTDAPKGLFVEVDFKNLPTGEHGFHIHEYGNCEKGLNSSGQEEPALAAGGHYDPDQTGKHLGPKGEGHRGDLPALKVNEKGSVKTSFYMPRLTAKEIRERSVVIHAGGDNYQDTPKALVGVGKRIACGGIK